LLFISSFYLPDAAMLKTGKQDAARNFSFSAERRAYSIGIGLAILQQLTGINAILYFAPQILLSLHQASDASAIFSALIIAGGNFVFTIAALFIIDVVGRRPILFFSLSLQSLALLIFGASAAGFFLGNTTISLVSMVFYIFGFAIGLGPVSWLIIAEIYPDSIRGKAIGISILINNIIAFLVAGTFLTVLQQLGKANTFFVLGFISLLGLFFVWYCVPETRQKSLDEIQRALHQDQRNKPA
jgi:MFS family permease